MMQGSDRKMRLLLFVPTVGFYDRGVSNPLGMLAIATYAKNHGHDVKICDRNLKNYSIKKEIESFNPDLIGISVMSSRGLKDALEISEQSKKRNLPVVWGGPMPTMNPEILTKCNCIDYIVMSEGEVSFLELINAIENKSDINKVKGIAFKNNNDLIITEKRDFADLSDFSPLDWSLINPKEYFFRRDKADKTLHIFLSKGCPCSCTFCTNHGYHFSKRRKRPVEHVIEEIKYLTALGMNGINFVDEIWCVKKTEIYEFCEEFKKLNSNIIWGFMARIGQFTLEELQYLYDAGCRWIIFGVESGSKEMLKKINKGISYDEIKRTVDYCRTAGITSITDFIVGFPDETVEQLKDTVSLALDINADLYPFYYFTPLPGSELYDYVVQKGTYKVPDTTKDILKRIAMEKVVANLSSVPEIDLRVIRSWFHWKCFISRDSINQGKPFSFAILTIKDSLNVITKKGILNFIVGAYKAFFEFLHVLWYANAYPKTRNKYGLIKK